MATCGGLALANSGLGAVHGLAGVIGGITGAAHGALCGRLLPAVMAANRAALPEDARLAWIEDRITETFGAGGLERWIDAMGLPRLAAMGVTPDLHLRIARDAAGASSMQANPAPLSEAMSRRVLEAAS